MQLALFFSLSNNDPGRNHQQRVPRQQPLDIVRRTAPGVNTRCIYTELTLQSSTDAITS